jgi:hypothetical protein
MFRKEDWNMKEIHKFLEKHNLYPIKPVDTTKTYYRFRLRNVPKNYNYRTITLSQYPMIKSVVMWKKNK